MPILLLLAVLIKGPRPGGQATGISEGVATVVFWVMILLLSAASLAGFVFGFWQFRSVDTLILNDRVLVLRRELGPIHQSLTFDLAGVRDVRHSWERSTLGVGRLRYPRYLGMSGMIAFDVGDKTHCFGLDLSPIDAVLILEALKSTASGRVGK